MPVRDQPHEQESFITTKALSVVRAECMQGRATVVWAVQQLKDDKIASDKIFILKQCWRPITAKPEGDLYPSAEEAEKYHIGRVYSYEDVKVGKFTINTYGFLQGSLNYEYLLTVSNTKESRKRGAENFRNAEAQESHVFIAPVNDHDPVVFNSSQNTTVTDRVLSWILLYKSHGWALHHFCDRLELIHVTNHIAEALKFLYFQKKTLQQDISIGNLMISSINGAENTEGCLIDFDYAKVVKKTKPTFLNQASNLILDEEQEILHGVYRFWGKKLYATVFTQLHVSTLEEGKNICHE
ncbi:hypothetical protein C0995_007787 [Termitomyces sp. Mi166|nr:hypothetical protein C0995_007787 [Termitomyces sp. Mi166\